MRELAEKARAEIQNLENHLREREIELEGRKNEIETLKAEKEHLNHKVSEVFPFETRNLLPSFIHFKSAFTVIPNLFQLFFII